MSWETLNFALENVSMEQLVNRKLMNLATQCYDGMDQVKRQ